MFTTLKTVGIFLVISFCSHQAAAVPLKTTRVGKPTASFVAHHKNIHSKGACLAKQKNHRTHQSLDPVQTATKNFNSDIKRTATMIFHKYLNSFHLSNPLATYAELKTVLVVVRVLAHVESPQTCGHIRAITNYFTALINNQFLYKYAKLPQAARTNARALGCEILQCTINSLLAKNQNSFRDRYHFLETSFYAPGLHAQRKSLYEKHIIACLMYGLLPSYKLESYIQKSIETFCAAHTTALAANNNAQDEEDEIGNLLGRLGGLNLHSQETEEKKQ